MNIYLIWLLSLVAVYALKEQIHDVVSAVWEKVTNKIKGN